MFATEVSIINTVAEEVPLWKGWEATTREPPPTTIISIFPRAPWALRKGWEATSLTPRDKRPLKITIATPSLPATVDKESSLFMSDVYIIVAEEVPLWKGWEATTREPPPTTIISIFPRAPWALRKGWEATSLTPRDKRPLILFMATNTEIKTNAAMPAAMKIIGLKPSADAAPAPIKAAGNAANNSTMFSPLILALPSLLAEAPLVSLSDCSKISNK